MSRGLYVRVYTGFFDHRKTARLQRAIGDAARWLPIALWAHAVDEHPDGDFSKYTAEDLAAVLRYTGDASSMLQALIDAGFMDTEPLRIHNWEEHNAYHKTYAERAKRAAAARWSKSSPFPTPPSTPEKDKERECEQALLKHASSIQSPEQASGPEAPSLNRPLSLEEAVKHFKGSYTPEEVNAAMLTFQVDKIGEQWRWGKHPCTDWKAAMQIRMSESREKGSNTSKRDVKEELAQLYDDFKFEKDPAKKAAMRARIKELRDDHTTRTHRRTASV